jgi:DNA-binding NarL/FixJ family response regulator
MAGGTLVISREPNNFDYIKNKMDLIGFTNVHTTDLDRDALSFLIHDTKPDTVIINSDFYYCCTPYMVSLLHREFPELYIAVVSVGEYPADLAMYFIVNGAKAYMCTNDGIQEFYEGLEEVRNRRGYIPITVQERIDARKEYPSPAKKLTPARIEVLRCMCNGFNTKHIADTLAISPRTVELHQQEIKRSLNARNDYDIFVSALILGIVTVDELKFRYRDFVCTPLPKTQKKK